MVMLSELKLVILIRAIDRAPHRAAYLSVSFATGKPAGAPARIIVRRSVARDALRDPVSSRSADRKVGLVRARPLLGDRRYVERALRGALDDRCMSRSIRQNRATRVRPRATARRAKRKTSAPAYREFTRSQSRASLVSGA